MNYLAEIFSNDETVADFIAWAAGISVLVDSFIAAWCVVTHTTFEFVALGTCQAAVIGAAGGVRVARERFKAPQQGQQQ